MTSLTCPGAINDGVLIDSGERWTPQQQRLGVGDLHGLEVSRRVGN